MFKISDHQEVPFGLWSLLFVVSIHTYIPHIFFGINVPPLLPGFLLVIAAIVTKSLKVRRFFLHGHIYLLVLVGFSILFAPNPIGIFSERFASFLYFVYSFIAGYLLFNLVVACKDQKLYTMSIFFLAVAFLGIYAERLWPEFRLMSDSFRLQFLGEESYSADLRDFLFSGGIRPKLFSAEPSFLAITLVCLILVVLFEGSRPRSLVVGLVFSVVFLYLVRSPVLMASIMSVVLVTLLGTKSNFRNTSYVLNLGLMAFTAFFMFLAVFFDEHFAYRLNLIMNSLDDSVTIRLIIPISIAWEVIFHYPFFGAGMGGYNAIEPIIWDELAEAGIYFPEHEGDISARIVNVFWSVWINLGLIGGAIFILALHRFVRISIGRSCKLKDLVLFYTIVFLLSNTMGGLNSLRFWVVFFLCLALIARNSRRNSVLC